jgi:D-glycero-D-manno-heptose 1,7-bisphosphate phosphatase
MVGLPASGKSQITQDYEKLGYVTISLDKKTMASATETFSLEQQTKKGNKVVIDNTNTTLVTRQKFIDFAKKNNLTIGAHYLNTSKDDCLINSLHRMHKNYGEIYMHTSDIPAKLKKETNLFVISAIFSMVKNFDKISKLEEFDQVETTKFVRNNNFNYTNKAIFIDLDGTVRKSNGSQMYPTKIEDIEILKNSTEILKKYKEEGYKIIAITNQSGITKGTVSEKMVKELIEHTNKLLDNVIDDYHFCPHLPPKHICYCRKPQSGVGVLMMHKHKLDLNSCFMIGDSTSDKTFAERLKIKYRTPNIFFER